MTLIHEDISYRIRGGLFEVQNEVGLGRGEEMYHKAFASWLSENGIPFNSKPRHELRLFDTIAYVLYPDFVVMDQVIVELKSRASALDDGDKAQWVNYLKCRNDRLGLLVNMGLDRVHVERYAYDPPDYDAIWNWEAWEQSEDPTLSQIQECMKFIFAEHQTGYSQMLVEKLLRTALQPKKLSYERSPMAEATYKNTSLGHGSLDCFLINQKVVLCYTALFDDNGFNCSRTQAFMKTLGVPFGLAVNFGKQNLQLKAFSI